LLNLTFLILNTSSEELILFDFVNELYQENLTFDYPICRLQTDSYGVENRFFKPGKIVKVAFHNNVCIIGRLMAKLHKGKTKSFVFLKISDEENYLLPDGTKIENPAITAMLAGEKEIMNIVENKEQ
jgi:hypothetical protein